GRIEPVARESVQDAGEEIGSRGRQTKKSPACAGLLPSCHPGAGRDPSWFMRRNWTPASAGATNIGASALLRRRRALLARRRHERIEVRLGDAEPENVVVAELLPRLIHLLELRIAGGKLVVDLDRRLMACLHDLAREGTQLHARGDQTSQR